jgi:hypothetical protein
MIRRNGVHRPTFIHEGDQGKGLPSLAAVRIVSMFRRLIGATQSHPLNPRVVN